MGNSITSIKDVVITLSTIQVQVSLKTSHSYGSGVTCAAFKDGVSHASYDPRNAAWNVYDPTADALNMMPTITHDAKGNALTGHTIYKIKCHVQKSSGSNQYRHTWVCTSPPGCVSGVSIKHPNGNVETLPKVGPITPFTSNMFVGPTSYYSFPSEMHGLDAFEFPRPTPRGMEIEITCCGGEECVFWLSLYKCTDCTGPKPGGLAHELMLNGWDSGSCSPRFDDNFATVAFHKTFYAVTGKVTETLQSDYREILVMFGIAGCVADDWCVVPHGPAPPGVGCGAQCPDNCAA